MSVIATARPASVLDQPVPAVPPELAPEPSAYALVHGVQQGQWWRTVLRKVSYLLPDAGVLQRTAQVMNELKTDDPQKVRAAGAIDLGTVQRYLNFHYSVTIDLFGADQSSNAAIFYSSGLKGRYEEGKRTDDHVLKGQTYKVLEVKDGQLVEKDVPMLNALNEVLRDDFIKDSVAGVNRWNKVLEKAGIPTRLTVPHKAFNRQIGALAGIKMSPEGRVVNEAEWAAKKNEWLATPDDFAFVASLMGRVVDPGKFAGWIAPPVMGINRQPVDFEYVRFG